MKKLSFRQTFSFIVICLLAFWPFETLLAQKDGILPEIPKKYSDLAEKNGLTISLDDFFKDSDGKSADQIKFEKFLNDLFTDMALLKPEFIQMSRCRYIFPRKSLSGAHGYFIGGEKKGIVLEYTSAKSCNHEMFHAYDLLVFARRFWSGCNHSDFTCNGPGFYLAGLGESSYAQLWRASSSIKRFSADFMRSYGQINSHEDAATVFENMIDPQKTGILKQRMRKSKFLKKKVLLIAAQTSWGLGMDYWQKKLELSPADSVEFNKIRETLDLEKQYHIKIHYTRNQLKRYGFQLRSTYALLDLSKEFLAASGLKEIDFQQDKGSKLKENVITVQDSDPYSLIFRLFSMYCSNRQVHFGADTACRSAKEASKIFGLVLLNPEKCAKQALKSDDYRKKVNDLKKITGDYLPPRFWTDYDRSLQDWEMEESVKKHFADSGICFTKELPSGVSGEIVSEKIQANAEKVVQLCCYLFSLDFLRQCGFRKIVFAKNMHYKGKKSVHWGIGDTLCLSPGLVPILFHFSRECYLRYDAKQQHPGWKWKNVSGKKTKKSQCFFSPGDVRSPTHERAKILASWIGAYYNLLEESRKSPVLKKKIVYVLQLPIFSPYAVQLFRQRGQEGFFSANPVP